MGNHGRIAPRPPEIRPLPSHKSQSGHLTGGGGGVVASCGVSSENLQEIVGLTTLGVVNADATAIRANSVKSNLMVMNMVDDLDYSSVRSLQRCGFPSSVCRDADFLLMLKATETPGSL